MNINHGSNQMEINWAPRKLGKLLLIGVACLAALYLLERTFSAELIAMTVFFLIALPALMIMSSDKRPCIIINDEGFFDRRLKIGAIPWSDIKGVTSINVHGTQCIGFQFYDGHKYRCQVPWFIRIFAYIVRMPAINTTAGGIEISFDDLYRLICDRHERFKAH